MLKIATSLIVFFLINSLAEARTIWVWEDRFSSKDKNQLIEWVEHSTTGIENLLGGFPYDIEVHFHKHTGGNGPVPWANTNKRRIPAVHFHVNTKYSPYVFEKDWTAPHELSHLLFPYLGRDGMWFAEGIASYLQYQIMYANNTKTWDQVVYKLSERFRAAQRYRQFDDLTLLELNDIVFQTGAFVRLYWAGAAYFLHIDKTLYEQKGVRLNDVIVDYLNCCIHHNVYSEKSMIRLFDKISRSRIFSNAYDKLVLREGFPAVKANLDWYKQNPPELR